MPAQPTIATPRLTLVPALLADLDELWTIWRDRDVRRYLFDDQDVTRETATDVLNGCLEQGPAGLGLWTIRIGGASAPSAASRSIIGCVGFMPVGVAAEHEPTLRGLVEPIVALAPAHWGNGYADEALVAGIDYVFETLGFASVAGVNDVPNEASHRMLLRAGFVPIGECPGPRCRLRLYRLERAAFQRLDRTGFARERAMTSKEESMTDRTGFRRAIEKQDLDALMSVFREDAVLHSPITFQPFEGKAAIRRLLGIILEVFQDFRYTDELDDADGMTKILVFRTKVRSGEKLRDAEGIDLIRFDEQGMVRDLTVMVRPRSSMESLLAEVQPRLIAAMQADAR